VEYFENTGSMTSPGWTHRGKLGGVTFTIGGYRDIGLGDLDGDGDLDLVGVSGACWIQCWENVGTPQSFQFTENPAMLGGVDVHPSYPVWEVDLADFDGDGDPDLLVDTDTSSNCLYLNEGEGTTPVESATWGAIKSLYR
jgi:hypothetical protein